MTTSGDNIKWFHKHVSSTYHLLETSVPIADVAMHTIKYIKRLTLTQVSEKVKSDFFRMLINYIKAQGNLVAFFIEPITTRLLELIDDDGFNQDAFLAYHLSMPNPQSSPSSELIQQKNTPLASNKSEVRMKPRLKQLQIFNDGSSNKSIPGQTTSHDEGVHSGMLGTAIMNSPRIGPENLAVSFAAEEEFEGLKNRPSSPWASNEGYYEPPDADKAKNKNVHLKLRKQYSIQEAWAKGNIAKYHRKLSGRRSSDFKFLFPYLECSTCSFPKDSVLIPIGEKPYTNVCANTDVFLDGDFISAFASLVCHHNHSTATTVPINSGKDVPQLTHVTYPNNVMSIKDCKPLPGGVQRIVAVMHTKLHYAVMEITVDTKTIKIFDGLRYELLEWKDHVIRVMRNCILVNPNVEPSAAQFIPDTAVSETVGRSRKPKESVNGYDVIIALQRWRLERGSFLIQSDGNNCGPIACLKIMELFHAIDVEAACEVYEKKTFVNL